MKTVEVPPKNKQLSKMVKQAKSDPLLLTQHGKAVAALVSVEGADAETISLSTNPKFLRISASRSRLGAAIEPGVWPIAKNLAMRRPSASLALTGNVS